MVYFKYTASILAIFIAVLGSYTAFAGKLERYGDGRINSTVRLAWA